MTYLLKIAPGASAASSNVSAPFLDRKEVEKGVQWQVSVGSDQLGTCAFGETARHSDRRGVMAIRWGNQ